MSKAISQAKSSAPRPFVFKDRRSSPVSIRDRQESSIAQRNVAVTLPKLKFLEGEK